MPSSTIVASVWRRPSPDALSRGRNQLLLDDLVGERLALEVEIGQPGRRRRFAVFADAPHDQPRLTAVERHVAAEIAGVVLRQPVDRRGRG